MNGGGFTVDPSFSFLSCYEYDFEPGLELRWSAEIEAGMMIDVTTARVTLVRLAALKWTLGGKCGIESGKQVGVS